MPSSGNKRWNHPRLKNNPFNSLNAAREEELDAYFVSVNGVDDNIILNSKDTFIVQGPRGSGKTALRRMVALACWPSNQSSRELVLEYTPDEFQNNLAGITDPAVFSIRHARLIRELALRKLAAGNSNAVEPPPPDLLNGVQLISATAAWINQMGFERCLCLVDGVDEFSETAQVGNLLSSLLVLASLLTETRFIFHFFLPPDLLEKPEIKGNPSIRRDRMKIRRLAWGANELKALIRQRLEHYSRDDESPVRSLGELCKQDPELGLAPLARRIDDELVNLVLPAQENTRALIDLAGTLLDAHDTNASAGALISQAEWQTVRDTWLEERAADFGLVAPPRLPLEIRSGQLYQKDRPLTIANRTSHLLLKRLVEAGGALVAHAELARAGWPEVPNPDEINADMIKTAISRLRGDMKSEGLDPNLVESVRGSGYRLVV